MGESFSVGEIAIVCGFTERPQYLGQEVEVTGPLDTYTVRTIRGALEPWTGYKVLRQDGTMAVYKAPHLRKRRPPPDDATLDTANPLEVVRWTDCPWRPAGVRA